MRIRNESGDHKYFTMVPNFIYTLGLSPYAISLYGHIKQVAGESGQCTKATSTLSKDCSMSAGMVSAAKKELAEQRLIKIEELPAPHGGKPLHCITICDVWERNTAAMKERSSCEQANSPDEIANSPDEINKNPDNKNNPSSKEEGTPTPEPCVKRFPLMQAVSDVTGVPLPREKLPNGKRHGNYAFIGKIVSELLQLSPPPTPDLIRQQYGAGGWWYREDWRGKKGECPSPKILPQTWGQWTKPKIIPIKPSERTKAQRIDDAFDRYNQRKHGEPADHPDDTPNVLECVSFAVT